MMLSKKIYRAGDSLCVTIPSEFVKKNNLKQGQPIYVDFDLNKNFLIISVTYIPKIERKKKEKYNLPEIITEKFILSQGYCYN